MQLNLIREWLNIITIVLHIKRITKFLGIKKRLRIKNQIIINRYRLIETIIVKIKNRSLWKGRCSIEVWIRVGIIYKHIKWLGNKRLG